MVPGCIKSFSVGVTIPSGAFNTEKIVPIETLTSMLDEPSSGSNNNMYSPMGYRFGIGCIPSISSEAIAAK